MQKIKFLIHRYRGFGPAVFVMPAKMGGTACFRKPVGVKKAILDFREFCTASPLEEDVDRVVTLQWSEGETWTKRRVVEGDNLDGVYRFKLKYETEQDEYKPLGEHSFVVNHQPMGQRYSHFSLHFDPEGLVRRRWFRVAELVMGGVPLEVRVELFDNLGCRLATMKDDKTVAEVQRGCGVRQMLVQIDDVPSEPGPWLRIESVPDDIGDQSGGSDHGDIIIEPV